MKKVLQGLAIGGAAAVLAGGLEMSGLLKTAEWASWDFRARRMATGSPSADRIKLILLDQSSLQWGEEQLGLSWPWPREVYGVILDFCRRAEVRCVAMDVLYTEDSAMGVADDEVFAEAIRGQGRCVGAVFLSRESAGSLAKQWPDSVPAPRLRVESSLDSAFNRSGASFPIDEVATSAWMLANVEEQPDTDSIFRRLNGFRMFDGHPVPSLGLAAFLAGEPLPESGEWAVEVESDAVCIAGQRYPMDSQGRAVLRYNDPAESYERLSAAAIIQSELRLREGGDPIIDPASLKGAYVIFGFSAPGLKDLRATPLNPAAPGALIHATLLDNLLERSMLREVVPAVSWVWLAGLCLAAGVAIRFAGRISGSLALLGVFLLIPPVAGLWAYHAGFWLPMAAPGVGCIMALGLGLVVNFAMEGRQKLFIKRAFHHYLSPAIIDEILRNPELLQLGGTRRELSLFFSDIEKFSGFSEKLDPVQLTELLNDYLSLMTGIIKDEGGTVDKYIGDAIVAFWNAPLAQPDHAERACRAAMRCQRELAARRDFYRRKYGVELHMRIGINTGEVVVGNMGSKDRFDYTVLGDMANLASRLEGANKAFGTYTMVSESTWLQCGGRRRGRRLARVRVVGREQAVTVYEPLDDAADESRIQIFEEALEACEARRWEAAAAAFALLENDPPAQRYAARCREQLAGAGDWDGIWNLSEK